MFFTLGNSSSSAEILGGKKCPNYCEMELKLAFPQKHSNIRSDKNHFVSNNACTLTEIKIQTFLF